MDHMTKLRQLIEKNHGLILTQEVTEAKIPRIYLNELQKCGYLRKIDRGAYMTKDGMDDELYRIQRKYGKSIFSHETALYLHGVLDTKSDKLSITTKTGYNTNIMKAAGLKTYTVSEDVFLLGMTKVRTSKVHVVRTYDLERTICDMVRSRNKVDLHLIGQTLQRYTANPDAQVSLLYEYAQRFRIENILKDYMALFGR